MRLKNWQKNLEILINKILTIFFLIYHKIALGIEAESPEQSGVKRSFVRTCSGKPDPKGNAHIEYYLIKNFK